MNKYSDTLNLPKTSFPMRANLANRETPVFEQWHKNQLYQSILASTKGRPKFILHDGPPYANGQIHIGHAVNKVLKDIIVKSKNIAGYHVNYIPGWDCHGLPIEIQIEKKHGKVGAKMSAKDFRDRCRKYADEQIEKQKIDFKRLGILGDWCKPYKTKDFHVEANEVLALKELYEKGFIRRGLKPVYWSTGCESALAEAELEYKDKQSQAIDVGYVCQNTAQLATRLKLKVSDIENAIVEVVIWTTTPWTLPASQAIAVNPDIEYSLCQINNEPHFIIIAKELVQSCADRFKQSLKIIASTLGSELESILCKHPYLDREISIILGHYVTTEAGTGCVHTAPAHGPEDFEVGKLYDLDNTCPVDEKGVFYIDTPLVGGLFVAKAEKVIIEQLQQEKRLFDHQPFQHSYPHCWRSKTPLIFRATNQWFIGMQNILDKALNSLDNIDFIPNWGQERMKSMLHNRPDWCISRQRYWGVPIAFVTDKQTGEMHPDISQIMLKVAELIREKGIDAWFDLSLEDLIGKDAENYEKCTDVLDVWFDSGLTHRTLERQKDGLSFPADLYLEGSDQHRGWFQSSLLTGIALNGTPPYLGLLTHGFTVDQNGRKMSKSEGNVVEPQKICKTLGADILRLWIASTDYRQEMSVSDEIFKRVRDSYRRIRNTMRYFIGNLYDFNPAKCSVDANNMLKIDAWAVAYTTQLQDSIVQAYANYEFRTIVRKTQNFCSLELGAFYLDILKDRLYTCQKDSLARRSAQTAMWHICQAMVRWLAPILSFTADEVWQELNTLQQREKSIFLTVWYDKLSNQIDTSDYNHNFWQDMQALKSIVDKQLEELRQAGHIGSSLDAEVTIYANKKWQQKIALLDDELRFLLITSYAHVKPIDDDIEQTTENSLEGIIIEAKPCIHNRCERSWHRREDVGTNAQYPDLDERSILNVYGEGEKRLFV